MDAYEAPEVILSEALKKAGIEHNNSVGLLGARFIFWHVRERSRDHLLAGTILGIEHSDEDGLEIFVSCPSFRGEEVVSLKYDETRGWYLKVKVPQKPWTAPYAGTLKIFSNR